MTSVFFHWLSLLKVVEIFFCTLPGHGMIHVASTITDLASFSVYVSEYKQFHFPSHIMICLYAHNT